MLVLAEGPGPSSAISLPWAVAGIGLVTYAYLVMDSFVTTKSLAAVIAPVFYLLWIGYGLLSLIAFAMLHVSVGNRFFAAVGHDGLAQLFEMLVAVLGALTILQSFTLKIADLRAIDFGRAVDRIRAAVYESVSNDVVDRRKRSNQEMASRLARRYQAESHVLKDELNGMLLYVGVDEDEVGVLLARIAQHARATSTTEARGYATEMVANDPDRVAGLLEESGLRRFFRKNF